MATIVSLYNHKGGVSKTTTTFNLAHALEEHLHKKVLLVDADPQCNLTELALLPIIDAVDERAEKTGGQVDLPGTTLAQALAPRLDGTRADVDVEAISLVQPDPERQIFVFRGDIALHEAEDQLSYAHSQRMTTDMHQKRNYVAIHDMLRRLADLHKFEIVLVDVGPSAGALTRSFFLSCDRFLVPVAPDRFNFQAMGSLTSILRKWIAEHAGVVADFRKLGLNVAEGKPQFRGLVMQRFQRYGGKPKPGFRIWMKAIPDRARADLIPALIEASGNRSIVFPACFKEPTAVEIPDFSSLAPIMLVVGKPVWHLTREDTGWAGTVWDERSAAMEQFRDLIFELADRIVA